LPHFLLRTPLYAEEAAPTWVEPEDCMSMQINVQALKFLNNITVKLKCLSVVNCYGYNGSSNLRNVVVGIYRCGYVKRGSASNILVLVLVSFLVGASLMPFVFQQNLCLSFFIFLFLFCF